MINSIKRWLKYRRTLRLVESSYRTAFYCQYWGRANNLIDRINRIKGLPPQYRLLTYQLFKRDMLNGIGYKGEWQFDAYSLS